jgi:hypothetical protein
VFDLPAVELEVIEHRAERRRCECGTVSTGTWSRSSRRSPVVGAARPAHARSCSSAPTYQPHASTSRAHWSCSATRSPANPGSQRSAQAHSRNDLNSYREIGMLTRGVGEGLAAQVARFCRHRQPVCSQAVADRQRERERVAGLRVQHVLQLDRLRRLPPAGPARPPHEAVDGVCGWRVRRVGAGARSRPSRSARPGACSARGSTAVRVRRSPSRPRDSRRARPGRARCTSAVRRRPRRRLLCGLLARSCAGFLRERSCRVTSLCCWVQQVLDEQCGVSTSRRSPGRRRRVPQPGRRPRCSRSSSARATA